MPYATRKRQRSRPKFTLNATTKPYAEYAPLNMRVSPTLRDRFAKTAQLVGMSQPRFLAYLLDVFAGDVIPELSPTNEVRK